jgi:hypothetical protein
MARRQPDAAKEQLWRDVLRRHKQSGLSVRGFCKQQSLSEARFHWWRRELARRAAAGPGAKQRSAPPVRRRRRATAARFLPLAVTPSAVGPAYEVVLPSGARVLVHACAEEKLAHVLSALEGRPC